METSKLSIIIPKKEEELVNDIILLQPLEQISLTINIETEMFEIPKSKVIRTGIPFNHL